MKKTILAIFVLHLLSYHPAIADTVQQAQSVPVPHMGLPDGCGPDEKHLKLCNFPAEDKNDVALRASIRQAQDRRAQRRKDAMNALQPK